MGNKFPPCSFWHSLFNPTNIFYQYTWSSVESFLIKLDSAVGHEGQINISFPHLRAMNSDIVGLVTLKCLSQPAGSSKHGCYGKSTSCASEKTEILRLASLQMIPRLVMGSAGSSGPGFKVCQITSLPPAKTESV